MTERLSKVTDDRERRLAAERLFDPAPHIATLANGRYAVTISNAGCGGSTFDDFAVTRWRGDDVQEGEGFFLYARDLDSGATWSLGYQPVRATPHAYEAVFGAGGAAIHRVDDGIESRMAVAIAADDGAEFRSVRLRNTGPTARRIELTSYIEVVLAPAAADRAHPAFAKLFVQTAWDAARRALIATRRPREAGERTIAAAHWLLEANETVAPEQFETDRRRFIGRGRTVAEPVALATSEPLSGTVGNVLDPIFSLRRVINLQPGETRSLIFALGVAESRQALDGLVDRHSSTAMVHRLIGQNLTADDSPIASWSRADLGARNYRPAKPTGGPDIAEWGGSEQLRCDNGYGGFTDDGAAYVMRVAPGRWPPMPWTHVVANENFGFLVSESGAATTWAGNSRLNRITPWSNDPVSDPHGEALYIADAEDGIFWSPQPGPVPSGAETRVRYGFGYCRFEQASFGIAQDVRHFVPRGDPVKVTEISLSNTGDTERRLSVYAYCRLVLGGDGAEGNRRIRTWRDAASGVLLAENPDRDADFAGRVAFAALIGPDGANAARVTGDRAAFIGRHGDPARPAALIHGSELDGWTGDGADPCFALGTAVILPPGATVRVFFLLGEAADADQAVALAGRHGDASAITAAFDEVRDFWDDLLTTWRVDTPVPAIDLMANGWLLYQNLSCRIWGRTAFYQSGGAFGFRDQLQDASALATVAPSLTRAQILLHAAHQFVEGDVLHWWHPPASRGIRTRFADDLLWLPFVTASYIQTTGDAAVLDENVPFKEARPLEPGEDEAYLLPTGSAQSASLYEHCCRALDRSLATGANGLPLMGSGDWNDGMNRVGREGRGESVWLGFFLCAILDRFIPLCQARGDTARSEAYRDHRAHLVRAVNAAGWDGDWYRRAYYDDGTPLGSAAGDECRIDALAQAWAVISKTAPPDRARQALDAVETHLISDADGLIRLLAPPFADTPHDPGYIKGYVAGVRENGGQYTHAALWTVMAMAEAGRIDRAAELIEMLSPVTRSGTPDRAGLYKTEPYVVAADVYGVAPHVGRGGWTWYTGSAGWMYRVILESVLGIAIEDGSTLVVTPGLPPRWPGYDVTYRCADRATRYAVSVRRSPLPAEIPVTATVDGEAVPLAGGAVRVPLRQDGQRHSVVVVLAGLGGLTE